MSRSLHQRRRQRGSLMISFALMFIVILGFIGLALDMAQLYNRKTELQNLADDVALTAASQLNGTLAGVNAAAAQASAVAVQHKYQFYQTVPWDAAALRFSGDADAADADWLTLGQAQAAPDGLLYAKVDTRQLDPGVATVEFSFIRALAGVPPSSQVIGRAVAGRSSVKITPLAICALSPAAAAQRINPGTPPVSELVEYGFRRGVAYNLLNLNPNGNTAVYYYLDPVDPLGAPGSAANMTPAALAPYVCNGTMPLARVTGAQISVTQGPAAFPLADELNSRFDQNWGVSCSAAGAPPDSNIKSYPGGGAGWWMSVLPASPTAKSETSPLRTVADRAPPVSGVAATDYGVLWSYGPAVQYAAAPPYTALPTASWNRLYPGTPAAPAITSYPTLGPYRTPTGNTFLAPNPAHLALPGRRVLNIALLACPVAGGAVALTSVLGIGQFFMTVPASSTAISGEFAGLVSEQALGGSVELIQ